MKKITKIVLFVNEIMEYFETEVKGLYSDLAYYDLLEYTESYFKITDREYEGYLEFTFGIDKKDFKRIIKSYKKHLKELKQCLK